MHRLIVFFGLFLCSWASVPRSRSLFDEGSRIIGGQEVSIEEVPYTVAILHEDYFRCGGSLIRDDVVLSAVTCVFTVRKFSEFTIRGGSHLWKTGGQIAGVHDIIEHELSENSHYNFALFMLSSGFVLGPAVNVISLPEQGEDVQAGSAAIASGWGHLKIGGVYSEKLHTVEMPVVDLETCKDIFDYLVTDEDICTGFLEDGGLDFCQGDYGGPLVVNNKLVGVMSWNYYPCAGPGLPGVSGRVSAIVDWIHDKIF